MTSRPKLLTGGCSFPDQETCKVIVSVIFLAYSFAAAGNCIDDNIVGVLEEMGRRARLVSNTLGAGFTLRQHLEQVQEVLRRVVNEYRETAPFGSAAHRALETFGLQIAAPQVCTEEDLEGDSHSIAQIPEILRFVVATVETAYAQAKLPFELPAVHVDLVIRGTNHREDVGAATIFGEEDAHDARRACIKLEIARETFCDEQFFGLLTRLHHEVYVHAIQAIRHVGQRWPVGMDCALAEGMMDRAAHHWLRQALQTTDLPGSIARARFQFATATDLSHELRFRKLDSEHAHSRRMASRSRNFGKRLFERLTVCRGAYDVNWASRIAMRLNVADLDAGQRRSILVNVEAALASAEPERILMLGSLEEILHEKDDMRLFRLIVPED